LVTKENETGDYFRRFYARRAQRILPPYFLVLVLVALFVRTGIDWHSIWWHFLIFGQNFSTAFQYHTGVLNPYWSLAVEEQYYLVWPLLCYFLSRRQLTITCIALLVVAPILRAIATPHFASYLVTFTLTPFRMDQLAAGSLLAIAWLSNRERVQRMLPWATVVAIVSTAVFFGMAKFPWWRAKANSIAFNVFGYSISSILFTSIVMVALCSKNHLVLGVLTNKWLMRLGTVSYMAYLIHEPVLYFTHPRFGLLIGGTLAFFITIALSALSWRFIEKPILERRRDPAPAPVTEPSGGVA